MIAVGRVTRSIGLKGELNVALLTDVPERFAKLKSVWVGADETQAVKHSVVSVRVGRSSAVLKLKDIDSRSDADGQRGRLVYVAEKDAIVPKKGSYFIHDVVGMKVLTEEGKELGTVQDVMQLPANDVWVVVADGKEVLIPATREIIRSVDLERRTVSIRPLEGLLE